MINLMKDLFYNIRLYIQENRQMFLIGMMLLAACGLFITLVDYTISAQESSREITMEDVPREVKEDIIREYAEEIKEEVKEDLFAIYNEKIREQRDVFLEGNLTRTRHSKDNINTEREFGIEDSHYIMSPLDKDNLLSKEEPKQLGKDNSEILLENRELKSKLSYYKEYGYILGRDRNGLELKDIQDIERYATQDDRFVVNPHLVISILYNESNMNSKAINGDCYGLGQMKVSTAEMVSRIYKLDDKINEEFLLDKEQNLRYTVLYLRYLVNKYNGNYYNVIMSYSGSRSNQTLQKYIGRLNDYLYTVKGISFSEIIQQ